MSYSSVENLQRLAAPFIWPFFRKYPYRGRLNIVRADARGAISPEDKFFYNRIPKNANSTIIRNLVEHSCYVRNIPTCKDYKNFYIRPAFASKNVVKDLPSYFKFVFSRNPYSRTLSAFLDKVVCKKHPKFMAWLHSLDRLPNITFSVFCDYLEGDGLYADPHWAPQSHSLLMPLDDFDFVGRFERLNTDLNHVMNQIFPDKVQGRTDRMTSRTHANNKLNEFFSDREIEIVSRLYNEDFQVLGYSTDFADAPHAPD